MERLLDIFRTLADPTRLRILMLLRSMELSVGELAQVLGQSQPRVSRHVKILADAGLTERRKEGSWVFLSLRDNVEPVFAAIAAWGGAGEARWAEADAVRLVAVRADRQAAAERFFEARATTWDKVRSLHVPEAEVEAAMARALRSGDRPFGRLVDVGTGTGRMLALFGEQARSALGIDRSPEMLRLARAKLAQAGLARAELRQGDMYALPLLNGAADVIIIHQVLHYAQQPAAAIAEAGRVLAPGGRLLIVDFAAHDRDDLRLSDAHVRLGFDNAQIAGWCAAAGLQGGVVDELAGGELTVKLWMATRPAATLELAA